MCTYIKSTGVGSDPIQQTPYAPPPPPNKNNGKTAQSLHRLQPGPWIRIRMDPHSFSLLDPDLDPEREK